MTKSVLPLGSAWHLEDSVLLNICKEYLSRSTKEGFERESKFVSRGIAISISKKITFQSMYKQLHEGMEQALCIIPHCKIDFDRIGVYQNDEVLDWAKAKQIEITYISDNYHLFIFTNWDDALLCKLRWA